jgi:hypothetical protein
MNPRIPRVERHGDRNSGISIEPARGLDPVPVEEAASDVLSTSPHVCITGQLSAGTTIGGSAPGNLKLSGHTVCGLFVKTTRSRAAHTRAVITR